MGQAQDVATTDASQPPGAGGGPGGDAIEGELALELRQRLFLCAPAADEGVQGRQVEGQVRGDGGVLEVPVVRGEQVELEVLGALVAAVLGVDHAPEPEVPLGDVQVVEEAGDGRGHGQPALTRGGQRLEGQPAPVAGPDGGGKPPGGQGGEDLALEEGGGHAELQGEP